MKKSYSEVKPELDKTKWIVFGIIVGTVGLVLLEMLIEYIWK
jgi:hypothetical protein